MDGPAENTLSDSYNWDVPSGSFTDDIDPSLYQQSLSMVDRYTMKPNYTGTMLKSYNSAIGTAAKAKVVATRRFTFTWVPKVAGSKPTKDLNVFIGGTATAEAYTQEDGVSVKAWIGAQPEDEGEGEEAQSSLLDNIRGGKFFRVSKEQTSGTVSLSLGAQSSAPGDQSLSHPQTDHAGSILSVSAKVDNRSVTLSRGGAINEWSETVDGVPVTHGDTIYSFTEHQSLQTPEYVPVPQKFTSALAGNWSTKFAPDSGGYDITWNWNAGGLEEYPNGNAGGGSPPASAISYTHWNGLSRVSEKGDVELWYGFLGNGTPEYTAGDRNSSGGEGKPPTTATVKYFVRDNQDQAEVEARYKLTIHEPIEIDSETKVSKEKGPFPLFDSNHNLAFHSGIVPPGETVLGGTHSYAKTGTVEQTTGWAFGIGGGVGWDSIKNLFKGSPTSANIGINGEYHWDNTVDYSGERATTYMGNLTEGQSVYIAYTVGYNEHTATYRLFNAAGENRRADSPPVVSGKKPLPSLPYEWKWQTQVGTSLDWVLVDMGNGDTWPDYSDNSETVLPSGNQS